MDQLDRTVAEIDDVHRGERGLGRQDLGRLHLFSVRVVDVVGVVVEGLDPIARGNRAGCGLLVGHERDARERVTQRLVAEAVVEVLVGVHDGDHLGADRTAQVLDHGACGRRRGEGVDHDEPARPADGGHFYF